MPDNSAAWVKAKQARLEVKPAPYTPPRPNEIVVRNYAVAINPIDWILQSIGSIIYPWIKYPFILGSDLAGEVAEVGSAVTRFQVGDRVLGHAVGSAKTRNSSLPLFVRIVASNVSLSAKCRARKIRTKFIVGDTLMDNEVSRVIYEDFLPQALAEGRCLAAPEPSVVGTGLDCLQAALDRQRKGMSAKKVVVSL